MIKDFLIRATSLALGKYNHIPTRLLSEQAGRDNALALYLSLLIVNYKYNLVTVGGGRDGSYDIPLEAKHLDVLISPGIGESMSFELDLLGTIGHIYMIDKDCIFDISKQKKITYIPKYLVSAGLADDSSVSIPEILDGCRGTSIMLQMDIEGSEWSILGDIPDSELHSISCLVIELHGLSLMWNYYVGYHAQKTISKLLRVFNVAYVKANSAGSSFAVNGLLLPELLEITFVNKTMCSDWEHAEISKANDVIYDSLDISQKIKSLLNQISFRG